MNELITSELISIQNIKVAMFFLPATAIWKWFLYIPNLVQEMAPNNQLFYLGSHYLLSTCILHICMWYILRNPCGVPNIFFRQLWLKDHLKLVKKHVLVVIECFFFLMFVLLMEQLVRNITVMYIFQRCEIWKSAHLYFVDF